MTVVPVAAGVVASAGDQVGESSAVDCSTLVRLNDGAAALDAVLAPGPPAGAPRSSPSVARQHERGGDERGHRGGPTTRGEQVAAAVRPLLGALAHEGEQAVDVLVLPGAGRAFGVQLLQIGHDVLRRGTGRAGKPASLAMSNRSAASPREQSDRTVPSAQPSTAAASSYSRPS